MGTMRYGPSAQNAKIKSGLIWLKERLEEYEKTGNTELLIDIANFAKIEWMHPSHPNSHFEVVDREEKRKKKREWTVEGFRRWFYRHEGD